MNEEAKMIFTPGPMISFRSARKLSSSAALTKWFGSGHFKGFLIGQSVGRFIIFRDFWYIGG